MIKSQPWRDLSHHGKRLAIPQDARITVDEIGKKNIAVLELRRKNESLEQRTYRRSAGAVIRIEFLSAGSLVVRVVKLAWLRSGGCAYDREIWRILTKVDTGLVDLKRASFGNVALKEIWLAVGIRSVVIGGNKSVTMRVDRVVIRPVALIVRDPSDVDLTYGDHSASLDPINGVATDIQRLRESVVGTHLLKLLESWSHDRRVKKADVV